MIKTQIYDKIIRNKNNTYAPARKIKMTPKGEVPKTEPKIDTVPQVQPETPGPVDTSKDARVALSDEPAEGVTQPPEQPTDTPAAGLLHEKLLKYHEQEFKEKATEVIENDRTKLANAEITNIRGNSRILVEKEQDKSPLEQVLNLKKETARRIRAYTDEADNEWYKLNYERLGSDKNGLSHEFNVGLGDILLDPDIKDVLVFKQDGSLIKAHRGVVPYGYRHAGRLGFLNENNEYVATFTGDKFRILSSDEMVDLKDPKTIEKYLAEYQQEEKVRETDRGNFKKELNGLANQDIYNIDAELDLDKSIAEQVKIPLDSSQLANAKIIEEVFEEMLKSRVPERENRAKIIAAAIVNAYRESSLRAEVAGDNGASVGLFQLHERGAGKGLSVEYRQDPRNNTKTIIEREVLAESGQTLIARANAGASVAELSAIFAAKIERPRDRIGAMRRSAKKALVMFGEKIKMDSEEVVARIDNGKGWMRLKSNQNTWIFGSSGVVGMHDLRNKIDFGNTGFFGIVGINPMGFRDRLKTEWPKIANLKLPKQIILAEMASNGLGSDDEGLIQKNLEAYADIKQFLKEKGVQEVKISTVQPVRGREKQIAAFNEKIKKEYGEDCIDINFKAEYAAADGVHLNKEGYEEFARRVKGTEASVG